MNAPARPVETSPQNRSALPDHWVDALFSRLSAMYGSRFADLWRGCDLAAVKATWAADLAVMSRDELAAGVAACRSRDWPPTLPEFMKLCRPPIDFDGALSEAVEQMARRESGSDRWSHPAIFWAAQSIAFELRNSPRKVLDGLWRSSLGAQLAKGQWPDIPDRQAAALPAPELPPVREEAVLAWERFKSTFGTADGQHDYLLWAKKPRSTFALRAVIDLAKGGDLRFVEIYSGLVDAGICTGDGRLLKRWKDGQWEDVYDE